MKIAVVRGPSLNKFEMQYYEVLVNKHEIIAITSPHPHYETRNIILKKKECLCVGQLAQYIPFGMKACYELLGSTDYLLGLEKVIRGMDIVHTAEIHSCQTNQALREKERGTVKKVVVTVSENIHRSQENSSKQRQLKTTALQKADAFLAISDRSKEYLIKEGAPAEKIHVIPHGIDTKVFKPAAESERNNSTILSVGRLVPEKGFDDIMAALDRLTKDESIQKKVKLKIVGTGPEKEALKENAAQMGLSGSLEWAGHIRYDEMPGVYQNADVFVLASKETPLWNEQFGMVLIEAMACGIPVVTTESGAIPQTVGDAALIARPGDPESLYKNIKEIITHPERAKALKEKGLEKIKKEYDRFVVAEKIGKIYEGLMSRG